MPTHASDFPDHLFSSARRLRRWERALMDLLDGEGFNELRPSLVLGEPVEPQALRLFHKDHLVALRWDFTVALARMTVRTFPAPPGRISYAGTVFRRPGQPWDPVEYIEVGCEHVHERASSSNQVDLELARILMAVPGVLGLRGGILALGHGALLRRPFAAERLPRALANRLVRAIERRAVHRAAEALVSHPAATRLLAHVETLLADPDPQSTLAALGQSPYASLLEEERFHLNQAIGALQPMLPGGLALRLDLADVEGFDFYRVRRCGCGLPAPSRSLPPGVAVTGCIPKWAVHGMPPASQSV
jgi:ATP phosphoribosyltransferase regulatory subunit HisZ